MDNSQLSSVELVAKSTARTLVTRCEWAIEPEVAINRFTIRGNRPWCLFMFLGAGGEEICRMTCNEQGEWSWTQTDALWQFQADDMRTFAEMLDNLNDITEKE